MAEYMEFRLAMSEVIAMGYAIGLSYNQARKDWRAVASFPEVGVKPWNARGASMEEAFMKVFLQIRTGVRQ